MKRSLKKYFQKRVRALLNLLAKQPDNDSTHHFHSIRIEIKKIRALLKLIHSSSDDFSQKKYFKPYKHIFSCVGRIREMQVEEILLKKHFSNTRSLYPDRISKTLSTSKQELRELVQSNTTKKMEKNYHKVLESIDTLEKKDVLHSLHGSHKKIIFLLKEIHSGKPRVHILRKRLKEYYFNLKSLNKIDHNEILSPKKANHFYSFWVSGMTGR